MPRQPRALPAGYPVHVVQRGANRAACFFRDADYLCYLQLLFRHTRECACALHAYALMPNHVHLLVTADDATGVSLLIKNVAQIYTQYLNRTRKRIGPLWEGRFKASIIADDAYLLACQRFIEMNPVRARLVAHPAEYVWSSHRANAGMDENALVTRHPLYIGLAGHDRACAIAYSKLFETGVDRDEEIPSAAERGLPLGRRVYRKGGAALRLSEASVERAGRG